MHHLSVRWQPQTTMLTILSSVKRKQLENYTSSLVLLQLWVYTTANHQISERIMHLSEYEKPVNKVMLNNLTSQFRHWIYFLILRIGIKKLQPLSSHLRTQCQMFYHPSSNVTVGEMVVRYGGRSLHIVRIPKTKPIPKGFKILH